MKISPFAAAVCILSSVAFAGCKDEPAKPVPANQPQAQTVPVQAPQQKPVQKTVQDTVKTPEQNQPKPGHTDPRQKARELNKLINDRHQQALKDYAF